MSEITSSELAAAAAELPRSTTGTPPPTPALPPIAISGRATPPPIGSGRATPPPIGSGRATPPPMAGSGRATPPPMAGSGRATPPPMGKVRTGKVRSSMSDAGGSLDQLPSARGTPGGFARSSMGDYPPGTHGRDRRMSGFSGLAGLSPEQKYARSTPFQTEYSSRRSYTGSAGTASTFAPMFTPSRMTRSYSVTSNGSRDSAQFENRDAPLPDDPAELKKKIKENWNEQDNLRMELGCKKEEISQLRQKVMDLKQELAAVNTSKGVLNEACVTGMMDVFALNSHISKLQAEKDALGRTNEQLKRESTEHDQERRGLLNLLDDGKTRLSQTEKFLEAEIKRRKEVETSRATIMERWGLELKWVRQELSEKTMRLKKLAKTNEKLARKLLSLEADSTEAKGIAKLLQKQNQQLDGDNHELTGCIMQLEQQINHLATEKQETDKAMEDLRQEHSQRLEDERSTLLSKMAKLESELNDVRDKSSDDDAAALKAQSEKILRLEGEKKKMEERVKSLSVGIEGLKEEQGLQEEAVAQMRKEYVRKLEEDTQSLRGRVQELERHLDDVKQSETVKSSAHKQTLAQISQLSEEKLSLGARVKSLENHIAELQGELDSQSTADKRVKETEVLKIIEEKNELVAQFKGIESQLQELTAQKQISDDIIRKLKQDLRDSEQQKATLTHQVNVLEWHLSGLYAEKQEALRTLEDRNLELIRLQQDLADKDEDLQLAKQENSNASEKVVVQMRDLKMSQDDMNTHVLEHQRRNINLQKEIEQLRSDNAALDGQLKKLQRKKPWLNFRVEFKF